MRLQIEYLKTSDLIPYARNARKHSDRQINQIVSSIKEFGFNTPIVIDDENIVRVGHGRLLAAQKLGMEEVPTTKLKHLSASQMRAYAIVDNQLGLNSEWDDELLALEASDLDFDFGEMDLEIPDIKIDNSERDETEDEVPEVEESICKPGDLWQLGDHRLLCGDCTIESNIEALMDGQKADMVFTDPPYGVDYDGGVMTKREKLAGDHNTDLYPPTCLNANKFTKPNAALYLWHAGVTGIKAAAAAAAAAAGWEIRAEIIWNKNMAQFGALSSQYKQKHEPAYYCFKKGKTVNWNGPTNEVTVWDVDRASKNEFHPTQKPVELAERAIKNHKIDSVLDLFLGSGSTLIACEKTGRKCFGMEIDPHYCDVIIKRWQDYSGKTATLVKNIQT